MYIYTETGWKQITFIKPDVKRDTTKAAEKMDRTVIETYASWARDHNAMAASPNLRTKMPQSALTKYIEKV